MKLTRRRGAEKKRALRIDKVKCLTWKIGEWKDSAERWSYLRKDEPGERVVSLMMMMAIELYKLI